MRWIKLEKRTTEHSPYFKIEDQDFELPDGRRATYSLRQGAPAVAVLALTPDRHVILARQFRPGPDKVLDELPGGSVDEGEDWEAAALRELREETGYVPRKIVPLGRFHDCAYSAIERRGFLALDCELLADQKLDPREFIEVRLKTLSEFLAQLRAGGSTDGDLAWAGLFEAGLIRP